jgi:hypothetical protein
VDGDVGSGAVEAVDNGGKKWTKKPKITKKAAKLMPKSMFNSQMPLGTLILTLYKPGFSVQIKPGGSDCVLFLTRGRTFFFLTESET